MFIFLKYCSSSFLKYVSRVTFPLILALAIIPVAFAIFLYRCVVWLIVRSFRKDLQSFITGVSATCVSSIPNKSISNMLLGIVVQGEITPGRISQLLQDRILNLKDSKGNLVYHRMKQTVVQFMGYAFWKDVKHFALNKQVREYDYNGELFFPENPGENDLQRIWLKLAEAPWKNNQIPWEFLTVQNYCQKGKAGPHTLIIFRVDHVYCDLYSLIGLFRVLFQTPLSMPIPSQKSRISSWRKWKSILTLPSELSKMLTGVSKSSQLGGRPGSNNLFYCCTSSISVDVLKRVKNKYGVAFSHVIVSTANGAIARALRNSGLEPPANLDADYVLPMPNHPGGFNAHMTQVKLEIPCNVKCAEERLHRTQDIFKSLEGSFLPLTNYHCFNILTLTPLPILKPILDGIYKSGHRYLLSNMSTSLTKEYADGLEMVDVFAIVSFSREIGLYVANWGLNNKLRFNFIIDKSVFGDEASAIKFASYFEEELKNL